MGLAEPAGCEAVASHTVQWTGMKKVRFGVVGVGGWGRVHTEVYSTHHLASLTAVCDLVEERAEQVAAHHGGCKVYTDAAAMVRDPEIDAVAVATPDFAHAGPVVAAAEAGKHIIVEKPLATTHEDLDRIGAAVRSAGVVFMVDFHCRWCPPIVIARDDIAQGKLGSIISGYLRLNDTIHVPTEMLSWAGNSSVLWFLGSHAVDTLRYLFDDEVERVYAVARSEVLKAKGIDVPDIYQAILEFQSGIIVTLENNWIVPNTNPSVNDFKVNILGSKGMINMDLTHNQLIERYLEDSSDHPDILDGPLIRDRRVGLAYESVRDFVECVATGKQVQSTLEDGCKVTKVLLAIIESAERRAPVAVSY